MISKRNRHNDPASDTLDQEFRLYESFHFNYMKPADCDAIIKWYSKNRRDLPWRETLDPYAVTVSEFMLQQTTVAAVLPKFHAWMQRFPDFESLAYSDEPSVLTEWSGLGYYQRARRLHKVAKEIVKLGQVPNTYEKLQELPGFGPYTAAAVASICFGRPALAIDTNVIRVLFRYYALEKPAQHKGAHNQLRHNMVSSLESTDPGDLNQALMELGATICKVREPGCPTCPLRQGCEGLKSPQGPERLPLAVERKAPLLTPGKALVCKRTSDDSILLVKGTALGLLSPLYQPPLLFGAGSAEEFHLAMESLADFLAPKSASQDWAIKYGISGRKLALDCSCWNLKPAVYGEAVSILKNYGLSVRDLPHEDEGNLPLSTLTRKILSKCRENR